MATTERGIYYQDDYKKAADILADMKKMAESTDDAIKKSEYNDKDVKDSIKEIQDKQTLQDKNIENIQTKNTQQDELIQKLQNNAIQESTEEATSLHLEDASDLPAVLNIRGNHYQEAQGGTSNLVVLNEGSITQDGITIDIKDGVGTVSGTNTSSATIYIEIGTAYLYKDKKYYIKKVTGDGGYSLYKNGKTIWFPDSGESSFSASETGEYSIRYSAGANAKPITTFKLSIYEISEQEWVQGKKAIPSVEYPSEISTVKGEMNVVVSNKNLYKITASDNNYNGIKLTVNQEEGYATATGTSTGYSHPIGTLVLKPGDYVFSGGPKNGDWNKARLSIYVKNTEGVFESVTTIYKDTIYSVHLDKETEYRLNYVIPSGTTVNDEKIYPQVEKDTVATEFVKHEEKIYNLVVQQEMLKNDYFNTEKEIHKWGYINTKNVTNLAVSLNTSNGDFRRYSVDLKINDRKTGEYLKILCTHFKYTDSRWHENEGVCGWESGQTFCIGTFNKELDTAEKMKNYLLNNDVEIYYELAEQEELDLTEEQKEGLNQLNNLELFKGVNNIYTEQDLALLKLDYTADTKMYIDNKISSQKRRANIWKNEIK